MISKPLDATKSKQNIVYFTICGMRIECGIPEKTNATLNTAYNNVMIVQNFVEYCEVTGTNTI